MSELRHYTSADLSRQLRDAGLDQFLQEGGEFSWHFFDGVEGDEPAALRENANSLVSVRSRDGFWRQVTGSARALRLDDVLDALTCEREGGPLCKGPSNALVRILNGLVWNKTVVEAAGSVLLQLLRERKERGAK